LSPTAGRPSLPPSLPMKRLLLVSFHFPPFNAIAAVRTGKFAKFLLERGWDVRVIAARSDAAENLPLEIPAERVLHTPWTHVDEMLDRVLSLGRTKASEAPASTQSGSAPPASSRSAVVPTLRTRVRRKLGELRSAILHTPDGRITWMPEALRGAAPFLGDWKPDIVYASAPPTTTLLVARALAKRYGVPWIAEFRDLWTDNPYYEFPDWRKRLERLWERRVISDAAALVTVSAIWRDRLRAKFNKPIALAMNGYVPTDFPADLPAAPGREGPLHILYTGMIYPGYRDPLPLFEAIAMLGPQRDDVLVEFIGTDLKSVSELATKAGVADRVKIAPPVKYRDSLVRQTQADVLLHLQWNDPKESGTISGKLFEYFGARRPVLGLGYDRGEVASLVAANERGIVVNDPPGIADQLRRWIAEKRAGGIKPLADEAVAGLTRDDQFVNAERMVHDVLEKRVPARAVPTSKRHVSQLDPTGMIATPLFQPIDTRTLGKPQLCVVVDTEEQFDWDGPFSRSNTAVSAIRSLPLAQQLFERYRVKPAYLLDYPIVTSDLGRRLFTEWRESDVCEIGAQLHPWVNPPHVEEVTVRNSFAGNLPPGLERQKLAALVGEIQDALGVSPQVYKAGRYGLGPSTATTLEMLGFKVDTSVLPYTDLRFKFGPDFRCFTEQAFAFGQERPLLQLPVTRAFLGSGHAAAERIFPLVDSENKLQSYARGLLARAQLVDRVTLTPEGIDFDQMVRLTRDLLSRDNRLFVLSFHSPSLEAGHTPYVVDQRTRDEFLARLERYLDFFFGELGGEATSPLALYDKLLGRQVTG
jgi:glycosyltransferase involved in cell wall biosynthesis